MTTADSTYIVVSIHAPVWGATFYLHEKKGSQNVSIHAPVWGATCRSSKNTFVNWKFQSTHPCGVRLVINGIKDRRAKFQSTHPCGVRPNLWSAFRSDDCFNPRTRVGCDTSKDATVVNMWCFNPRTRVGCDGEGRHTHDSGDKFQSTHPCGVRLRK